ncbi:MAG: hypothetical protein JO086_15815 [Acidimicrobiia bacterium]|nr:hypothetical protein [Acidimicrobiia bacterium]
MRRRWRAGLAACVAVASFVGFGGSAFAGSGLAVSVDVHNSQESLVSTNNANCTWQVASDITLVNLTDQTLTITTVADQASWAAPDDTSGVQSAVTVLDDGGLRSGDVLAPHEQRTFTHAVVEFAIPCKADNGDLMVRVSTAQGTNSGDAPFLGNGTPVPLTSVGIVLLTAAVAVALLASQRRAWATRRGRPTAVAGLGQTSRH